MATGSDPTSTGARVRALRVERGLSQQELGGAELSASYLSRIEAGTRPATRRVLAVLAGRLGTTTEYLRDGTGPRDEGAEAELALARVRRLLDEGDPTAAGSAIDDLAGRDLPAPLDRERRSLAARHAEATGDLTRAIRTWAAVQPELTVGTDRWFEGAIALTRLHRLAGDLHRSTELGEQHVAAARRDGVEATVGGVRLLMTVVVAYVERGDLTYAQLLAERAADLADVVGDPAATGAVHWNRSVILAEQGDLPAALESARRAEATLLDAGRTHEGAKVRTVLAHLLTRTGRAVDAGPLLEQASAVMAVVGTPADRMYLHLEWARAAIAVGRLADARRQIAAVLDPAAGSVELQRSEALLLRGCVAVAAGRRDEAVEPLRLCAELLAAAGAVRYAARAWAELAAVLDEAGDVEGSRDAYRAALRCAGIETAAPEIGRTRRRRSPA